MKIPFFKLTNMRPISNKQNTKCVGIVARAHKINFTNFEPATPFPLPLPLNHIGIASPDKSQMAPNNSTSKNELSPLEMRMIVQKQANFFHSCPILRLSSRQTNQSMMKHLMSTFKFRMVKKHEYPSVVMGIAENELKRGQLQKSSEMAWLATDLAIKRLATKQRAMLNSHHHKKMFIEFLIEKYKEKKDNIFNGFAAAEDLHANFYDGILYEGGVIYRIEKCEKLITVLGTIQLADGEFIKYCLVKKIRFRVLNANTTKVGFVFGKQRQYLPY